MTLVMALCRARWGPVVSNVVSGWLFKTLKRRRSSCLTRSTVPQTLARQPQVQTRATISAEWGAELVCLSCCNLVCTIISAHNAIVHVSLMWLLTVLRCSTYAAPPLHSMLVAAFPVEEWASVRLQHGHVMYSLCYGQFLSEDGANCQLPFPP